MSAVLCYQYGIFRVESQTSLSEERTEHAKEDIFLFSVNFCILHLAFEETLQHPDLKVDLGLCAVNLAVQHKR